MKIFNTVEILSVFSILIILLLVCLTDTLQQKNIKRDMENLEISIKKLDKRLSDIMEPSLPEWEEK
jgi:hypothetical protein